MIKVAIIGGGLIGRKRALALPKGVKLEAICDKNIEIANKFANDFKCRAETNLQTILTDNQIDAVIICTTHKFLSKIAAQAILNGKHVLVEKPGARSLKDFKEVEAAYAQKKVVVMFGYNHRYHPAILLAKKLMDSKKYGSVLFIRSRHGHGARLGYNKEWRFNKDISGGGQLIDQGAHLIDLTNYFSGPLDYHVGYLDTLFWKTKLEDSAFLILKGRKTVANLVTTCLEWKNIFSFEIMLQKAKIDINGLGRSYGTEKLTLYTMKPEMGPPNVKEWIFPEEDKSWAIQNRIFFGKIKNRDYSNSELKNAKYVLEIIDKSYRNK